VGHVKIDGKERTMFDGVVDLSLEINDELDNDNWVASVQLFNHSEYGYVTVMAIPGDNGPMIKIQQLSPELQNLIPVYLPMIMKEMGG
jgi:hypothetical protein